MTTRTTKLFIGGAAGTSEPPSAKIVRTTGGSLVIPLARSRYGSLTTSFGIISGKEAVFIDNGSGIVNVVPFLLTNSEVTTIYGLQTHYHADHRSGVQTNRILFTRDRLAAIYAPKLNGRSFEQILTEDFSPETWPISPKSFGIKPEIREFGIGDTLSILGGIKTFPMNHPGGAAAFRFQFPDKTIVIATDNELSEKADRRGYANFVSGADILYVDVQYREREYLGEDGIEGDTKFVRRDWGHSTPEMLRDTLALCPAPPTLLLAGHHEPRRSDADLAALEHEMRETFRDLGLPIDVRFAKELDMY